jgi:hypothetical protein
VQNGKGKTLVKGVILQESQNHLRVLHKETGFRERMAGTVLTLAGFMSIALEQL